MRELATALAITLGISLLVTTVVSSQQSSEAAVRLAMAVPPASAAITHRDTPASAAASAPPEIAPRTSPDAPRAAVEAVQPAAATPTPPVSTQTTTRGLPPNEAGQILVLEYHLIGRPSGRWTRTPEEFRADIDRLIEEGYYPINLIDLADGYIDVPLGKSPIVITFDDSSSGQCRYRSDGTVDPDSACGILIAAAERDPEAWRTRATFFVLIDVDVPDRELFGQPEWADRKLNDLVAMGMEIGSHTVSHINLSKASAETIRKQLAVAEDTLERLIPGYEVRSLSLPMGAYPDDERLLHSGEWKDRSYDLDAAVEVAGGPSHSPQDDAFDRFHIRRTQVFGDTLDYWLNYFAEHPELRYVSDGQTSLAAAPGAARLGFDPR
jgi:peptidoglycan/xylan/chitin deacetylase (PgdA/CDA1 family)